MTAIKATDRDLRFGCTLGTQPSRKDLVDFCRRAEAFGFDTAAGVDHLGLGLSSPLLSAMAAAYASEHLTVGSYVLNLGFWNPSVLARDVATLVRLTDGRVELGLGTGLIKEQFDEAGFAFHSFQKRHEWVAETIDKVRDLLANEHGVEMPPLLIGGGGGERMIRLIVEQADIFSTGGRIVVPGQPPGTLRLSTASEAEERMAFFCSIAGDRVDDIERNVFILGVFPTDDRRKAVEEAYEHFGDYLSVEEMLECPFLLIGTEEEMARQIIERRERYGYSYFTVQRPHMDLIGPSIKRVRELV